MASEKDQSKSPDEPMLPELRERIGALQTKLDVLRRHL